MVTGYYFEKNYLVSAQTFKLKKLYHQCFILKNVKNFDRGGEFPGEGVRSIMR
jgi:hypothetical protein